MELAKKKALHRQPVKKAQEVSLQLLDMVQRFTMDHKENIYKVCLRTIIWLTVESGRLLTSAGQALRKSRRQCDGHLSVPKIDQFHQAAGSVLETKQVQLLSREGTGAIFLTVQYGVWMGRRRHNLSILYHPQGGQQTEGSRRASPR